LHNTSGAKLIVVQDIMWTHSNASCFRLSGFFHGQSSFWLLGESDGESNGDALLKIAVFFIENETAGSEIRRG